MATVAISSEPAAISRVDACQRADSTVCASDQASRRSIGSPRTSARSQSAGAVPDGFGSSSGEPSCSTNGATSGRTPPRWAYLPIMTAPHSP